MKHPFFILKGVWMALNLTLGLCSINASFFPLVPPPLQQNKISGTITDMATGETLPGNTTLMGKNQEPLVIFDAIPGNMRTMAAQDIESIDVLKDGSAIMIFLEWIKCLHRMSVILASLFNF